MSSMYPGVVELASTKVHDVTDSVANVFETESSGSGLRHSDPSRIVLSSGRERGGLGRHWSHSGGHPDADAYTLSPLRLGARWV